MADIPLPVSTRALLRERDYVLFWISRWMGALGSQIQGVTMGWQMYAISRRSLSVGASALNVSLIGLVTFVPLLLLVLPAGESADRYDRRRVLVACYGIEAVAVAVLAWAGFSGRASVGLLLVIAAIFGGARAFFSPANSALAPMLVPRELLPRAIAMSSLAWQTASVVGPALAGLLIALSPGTAYLVVFAAYASGMVCLALIRGRTRADTQAGSRLELIREGLSFVWRNKIVFGAISLDLAAVILGGATALLPAFARDVLKVGPQGFGLLRMAPAVGATAVAVLIARRPIAHNAGAKMFAGVAVFGAATVVFGVSRQLWLSLVALAVLGGADAISVFIRQTLVQLKTPDVMRGRVSAVSGLFISASNELGEFESGLMARLLGVVGSAVFGGLGALAATGLWAWLFPALRKADGLD